MTDARFEPGELDRLEEIVNAANAEPWCVSEDDIAAHIAALSPATAKRLIQAARGGDRLRGGVRFSTGEVVEHVHMGVRGTVRTEVEGWYGVEWKDGSVAVVRPSALRPATDGGK